MYLYTKQTQAEMLAQMHIRNLRPWQAEPLRAIQQGRDTFVSMSTGGGKSLLYQLPAAMEEGRSLTIVISPLRSLQADQVEALGKKHIKAVCINSDLTSAERRKVLAELPRYALLYAAPEQLPSRDLKQALTACHVERVVVDEAHILPLTELDFRTAYGEIGAFIRMLPQRPQIVACTATATAKDRRRIIQALGMQDADVFTFPIRRENLRLSTKRISVKPGPHKKARLEHQLMYAVERNLEKWDGDGAVIIYTPTAKRAKQLCRWLKGRGWPAAQYTGKRSRKKRRKAQKAFQSGKKPIMVATNAFGLGIDKADVRLIIHAGLPLSLDGYVQEIGRAGRDGKKSKCVLLYTAADFALNERLLRKSENEEAVCRKLDGLYALRDLVESDKCIWKSIEKYFGEKPAGKCGRCSHCKANIHA